MNRIESYSSDLKPLLAEAAAAFARHDDGVFAKLLRDAVLLAPQRLDLWHDLASHYIQAGAPETALEIYERLHELVPRDASTLFSLAHWLGYSGQRAKAERIRGALEAVRPTLAADLLRIWGTIDAWLSKKVDDNLPPPGRGWGKVGLVVLGYKLNPDGGMHEHLVDRLEKALEGSRRFVDYRIVVTGGVPRGGTVEAEAMRLWLEEKGVPPASIFEEGYARDLVENIVYSRYILDIMGAESVVAITSANNVRRAGAALEITAWTSGSSWRVYSTAASGESFASFTDDGSDRLKLFRDAVRAYGVPMMQTYPELSER